MEKYKYVFSIGSKSPKDLTPEERSLIMEKGEIGKKFLSSKEVNTLLSTFFELMVQEATTTTTSDMKSDMQARYKASESAQTTKKIFNLAKRWVAEADIVEHNRVAREEKKQSGKIVPNALKRNQTE